MHNIYNIPGFRRVSFPAILRTISGMDTGRRCATAGMRDGGGEGGGGDRAGGVGGVRVPSGTSSCSIGLL